MVEMVRGHGETSFTVSLNYRASYLILLIFIL